MSREGAQPMVDGRPLSQAPSRRSLAGSRRRLHFSDPSENPAVAAEHLRRELASGWVEEVMVGGSTDGASLANVVALTRLAGKRVRVVGEPAASLPPAARGESWSAQRFEGGVSWLLHPAQPSRWRRVLKRVIDAGLGAALLLLLSPLLLMVAFAVWRSSPGPILYPWRVVGRHGRPFVGYKFRTMVCDADILKSELLHRNEMVGPVFKLRDDPRLTGIGRWLRKYSLDELPQLVSVVRGDMSLVGPRPPFASEYQEFELWQMRKLSVTPGLTCLWQVNGRNQITDFAEWARLDLHYIDSWSLRLDAAILVRTLAAVVKGTGR